MFQQQEKCTKLFCQNKHFSTQFRSDMTFFFRFFYFFTLHTPSSLWNYCRVVTWFGTQGLSIPEAVSVGQLEQAGKDRGTPAYLYPERGGMYFSIPHTPRQRALIINKLGTRHGVPQGDQPKQTQNRETDRERRAHVEVSQRGRREGEEKTKKSRQERFGNDIEEQVGEESR